MERHFTVRLEKCSIKNFGSYKTLDFNYSDKGLILVKGATGSGKTTFLDIPCWILYGVTSKDGSVNEVCSWFSNQEDTTGSLEVVLPNEKITIVRVRGKSNKNDLYMLSPQGGIIRGKDIVETQKLIIDKLSLSLEEFCLSTYFNEFSSTANFFSASAKDRRKLFEKITNLEFVKTLSDKLILERKNLKVFLTNQVNVVQNVKGSLEQAQFSLQKLKSLEISWSNDQNNKVKALELKSKNFDLEKSKKVELFTNKVYKHETDKKRQISELIDKIDALDEYIRPIEEFERLLEEAENKARTHNTFCHSCGQLLPSIFDEVTTIAEDKVQNARLMDKRSLYVEEVAKHRKSINPYAESLKVYKAERNSYLAQLEDEKHKINPFSIEILSQLETVLELESKFYKAKELLDSKSLYFDRVNTLINLMSILRAKLLSSSIKQAEEYMNQIFTKYFDSEFTLEMIPDENDSLSINLNKGGYPCYYTQLSKGQRQILKLTFTIAIMRLIGNQKGVSVQNIFFDEPSDGLDEELKQKCVDLLRHLLTDKSNIFVVEHSSSVHDMYDKQYEVKLIEDESKITSL